MIKSKHDIRESSPVEALVGNPPSSIVRWGISSIAIVFVISLAASWIISYPYIVSGKITITTSNPPASMMAHRSGQIKSLFVEEGQDVLSGEQLALIETSADLESVIWLSKVLANNSTINSDPLEDNLEIMMPEEPDLGELRANYSSYKTSLTNYINHVSVDYYGQKIKAVQAEIQGIDEYIAQLEIKEALFVEKLRLVEIELKRDSSVYIEGFLSLQEFEDTKKKFLSEKIELEQVRLDKKSRIIDRAARFQDLEDYKAAREEGKRGYYSVFENERVKLQGELEIWYMEHLIKSPIDGKVTFSSFWGNNQVVEEGDIVMTVIPEGDNEIIGRIEMSMRGSGKVFPGLKVLIKLSAYPFLEYGVVEGVVESISQVATNDLYIVDVSLPDGLLSNYGHELQFNQNMSGTAEIIAEEMRLIQRILDPFRYIIEKNRLLTSD